MGSEKIQVCFLMLDFFLGKNNNSSSHQFHSETKWNKEPEESK